MWTECKQACRKPAENSAYLLLMIYFLWHHLLMPSCVAALAFTVVLAAFAPGETIHEIV